MLNLYQLQSFVTVVSEGSMTAAADKLYLTQPAISQQIRNLEEELGVEVLVRGVRQIKPTLQGELLFDYARRILQLANQAEVAVRAMGAELSGELKVGTLNSLGIQLMSPIVARLLKHNPKLSVRIDYAMGEELIEAFERRELDILILPETEKQYSRTLQAEKRFLMAEELWLVGSGKDTEMPTQASLSEIRKYPYIGFNSEYPGFNVAIEKAFRDQNLSVPATFSSQNVGTLKRVIEAGLGWGFLPSLSVRKQVRMGRMTHVMLKDFEYKLEFFYYFRKTENTPLMDVFFQALQQQDRA